MPSTIRRAAIGGRWTSPPWSETRPVLTRVTFRVVDLSIGGDLELFAFACRWITSIAAQPTTSADPTTNPAGWRVASTARRSGPTDHACAAYETRDIVGRPLPPLNQCSF